MRANTKPVPFLGLILRIWAGSQNIPGKFLPWSTSLFILLFLTCLCCNARICCSLPTPWLFSLLASFQCQGVYVCKIQSFCQCHDKKSQCSSQKTATLGWKISLPPSCMWPLHCSNHADMHASGRVPRCYWGWGLLSSLWRFPGHSSAPGNCSPARETYIPPSSL